MVKNESVPVKGGCFVEIGHSDGDVVKTTKVPGRMWAHGRKNSWYPAEHFSKILKDEMSDFCDFIVFKAEVKLDKSST